MAAKLAVELHSVISQRSAAPGGVAKAPRPAPTRPMNKDFQTRTSALVLALLTLAAAVFAWINFQKEREFQTPYDGVWWVEQQDGVRARQVDPDGPGAKAGIKEGDVLVAINDHQIKRDTDVSKSTYRVGIWNKATYSLTRDTVQLPQVPVILIPRDNSENAGFRLIALIYLGIGLYILFRRWTAPRSMHFYLFCLVSFIRYSFHYTGKLNEFDWIILWSNIAAELLQPALFLHFVLTFPETKSVVRKHRWVTWAVYLPAALLLAVRVWAMRSLPATELLRWQLDRAATLYGAAMFVVAAGVLWHTYKHASTPILRQQMKWVTRGTILAITPYTLFYVLPWVTGSLATPLMKFSVLSLVFLPLTFGYAIFRYRLMDVDLIFKRGVTYTLASAAIVGFYFASIGLATEILHTRVPSFGKAGLIVAIAVTALLFEPVKNWIQAQLDRIFYRKRYDYRKTLIEFGRELSSETDLDKMLSSVLDRISRTLVVDRAAIFLAEPDDRIRLAKSFGIGDSPRLDLSFLGEQRPEMTAGHLFFDNTHQVVRERPSAQESIARLDLNYYIPCKVQNRTIAVLGLGKTVDGDFLSSEDVELVEALAGYLGIAVQNALLYASLEQKVMEYERLKDFNENIVESISVGVLAIDLDDRIEFWNSQMEVMFAKSRSEVLGAPISEVLPANFAEEFYRVRQAPGIHNLYKFRLETPAGDTRTTNIAIAPLVTRRFHVIGRLIILDDITERTDLETQLSQAEKLSSIGLLAAGVAHEVNTPLAVISSYAQMLQKQVAGDEKQSKLLEKITQQTFRASEIVNNLLNFSRTSGTEFSQIDINRVIHDTLALLEHQFKTAHVSAETEFAPSLPAIYGNAGKLQQVFLNLFLNARDAMPGGGKLRIVTSNGSGVYVSVSDTGVGISQEHLQRIYDPFFTTKTAPANGRRGTGLGLSVTYGIIQEHAGKISVESHPGEGTTFVLEFPMLKKAVNV